MSQKKPPTPLFEQHSSSSDDEEQEVSGEEEATRADSSSDEEEEEEVGEEVESSESESDEQDPKPVTPRAPVKPVVVQSAKSKPDLAPASDVTGGKKRPGEESMAVSKKIKKKRVAEEVVKKVGDYPKTPSFLRVFSEDDEIAILKALLNYSAEKCIDPIDYTDFHDFVKKSIHIDVTKDQLSRKIRSIKSKYKNNAINTKEIFGKAHDQSCFNLSKKIWGKSPSACGGSELKTTKRIPKTQIPQVVVEEPVPENISWSELAKTRDVVGMMCLSDDTFKKNLELLSNDEARAAIEDKLKNIVTAEVELTYKRLELSRELMKSSLDGHRG